MLQGSPLGKKSILRLKMFPDHKNGTLRDPTMWRVLTDKDGNFIPHFRIGTQQKAWPLYDFACPFIDSIEGVTHSLRSQEYGNHDPIYHFIQDKWNIRKVHLQDYSRLEFQYTTMSKRKLKWFVENGYARGWDDPRFPTVQGLLARGLLLKTIREFLIEIGGSKSIVLMNPSALWAKNKQNLDPIIPRLNGVVDKNKVVLTVENHSEPPKIIQLPNHPNDPSLGKHDAVLSKNFFIDQADARTLSKGMTAFLMFYKNVLITEIQTDAQGIITSIKCNSIDGKIAKTKISWVSKDSLSGLPSCRLVKCHKYSHLLTKKKLEKDDVFENFVNHNSESVFTMYVEPFISTLKKGTHFQLLRHGYWIVDSTSSNGIDLVDIPTK